MNVLNEKILKYLNIWIYEYPIFKNNKSLKYMNIFKNNFKNVTDELY